MKIEKRRASRQDRPRAQLEPSDIERIRETIAVMRPWDQFTLTQLFGGDWWYHLDANTQRDLGRHMGEKTR